MPKYFETMGIPVLSGRSFTSQDSRGTAPLGFVVNQEFVKRFLESADPLAQRISVLMRDENPFSEIVGVVGDVREGALDKSPEPTVYFPHSHLAYPGMTLVVRTTQDPMALAADARNIIREMDPNQPVTEVRTMEQVLASTVARQRFAAILLGAFSALALLLAALGVYSVLSYIVVERSQELGIRMAVGAQPGDVVRLVLRQGLGWTGLGLAVGVALTLAFGRFLGSLLFGVAGTDFMTMTGVSGLLLVVGFLATLLPAWRAVRLDPVRALRQV
jgi:putative ABC transport system permease protein